MKLCRRQIFWFHLLVFVAFCPLVVHGQDYHSQILSNETAQASRTLIHAQIFNFGGIGFVSAMTREEKAFRLLLKSENSAALFQRLLHEANPEGQLYALYGLYLEDPVAFQTEVERLKNDDGPAERWEGMIFIKKGQIRTADGCVLFRKDRRALIEQMANGDFDEVFRRLSSS